MFSLFVLIAIIAGVIWFKMQGKKEEERKYVEQSEARLRSQQIDECIKWFDNDYAAFDKYLEDYQAKRLFFPVHVETLYAQDFGGYNVQDIYNVLSVLIQDMEENDKILSGYGVSGAADRANKIQRCKQVQGKYYGERKSTI